MIVVKEKPIRLVIKGCIWNKKIQMSTNKSSNKSWPIYKDKVLEMVMHTWPKIEMIELLTTYPSSSMWEIEKAKKKI